MGALCEHQIPGWLVHRQAQAINLKRFMPIMDGTNIVFPSPKGKTLSDMALRQLMRGMRERGKLTVDAIPHGFRSTFRDWAAEQTNYPDEIRKAASGHATGDAVKEAYQRSALLEKRRRLMNEWAKYCDSSVCEAGEVVSIKSRQG
jgi:integrase